MKRNVVTLSEQTLTGGQKGQVRANIGAAAASELTSLENGLAIVVDGNKTAYASGAAIGDYVFVKNSTITDITDGLYKAAKAIPYNTTVDKTYFTACPKGLGGEVASLSDHLAKHEGTVTFVNNTTESSEFKIRKAGNVVCMNGRIKTIADIAGNNGVLCTLPQGFIPSENLAFSVVSTGTYANNSFGLWIKSDGKIYTGQTAQTIGSGTYFIMNLVYIVNN